ncbi:MAG TPA: TIGR03862 family flavoprotein [Burkholderiales bacterium]|nr:TIGR03862 family flavoprotein [Burkholderiales bacterium]
MTIENKPVQPCVAVIGGGPAGLMAAEVLVAGGAQVAVYDAMPSVGRKFLLAGKGGLNLTHAEDTEQFHARYGARRAQLEPLLRTFGADALCRWAHELGIETFVGSSGRVFPREMKAAPLLRAWLHRLRAAGVHFHARHRWQGWDDSGVLRFATPDGERRVPAGAVVLALGGGSWARLGSDGAWVSLLAARGIAVAPLQPANCGFDVGWSEHFRSRFAGQPVKSVIAGFTDAQEVTHRRQGEFIITDTGIEGSLIYALSAALRDTIAARGMVTLYLDLAPDRDATRVLAEVTHPRGSRSLSSHLQSRLGIKGVKAGLLREALPREDYADPEHLAAAIKALPLKLTAPRPLDEAISSAGGVTFGALDERLMLRELPGVFCAGEMLDWEAPTGGYLLTACFATGRAAGLGALEWLAAIKPQKTI